MSVKSRIITLVALSALAAAAGAAWQSETIASEGNIGAGCSLAVDRWGRPHISFVDVTNGLVKYARYDGSRWDIQTIASDVDVQGDTDIALDAFDKPHVIFQDRNTEEVKYMYLEDTSWRMETIDEGTDYGLYVSISVWPVGPRVAYTVPSGLNTNLKYAYRENDAWEIEDVLTTGSGGFFNHVLVDNDEKTHIFFYGNSSSSIKHAIRRSSGWSIEDIAEGIDCDAVLDPDGKTHISFPMVNSVGLYHAVSTIGGSWKIENVPPAVVVGAPAYTGICLNGSGDVFISYFNLNLYNLHIVMKQGTTWTHERVATGGYTGRVHSIAPGPDGYPIIVYYDLTHGDLKIARHILSDVELKSFTARRSSGGPVDVRWEVGPATTVAGYNVYRAAENGKREKLNDSLIVGMSPFRFRDADADSDAALEYWLEAVAATGKSQNFGPASVPPAVKPGGFALHQNVPNPAREATTFSFELAEGSNVNLAIYDAAGRKVADVAEGYYGPGLHDVAFENELAPGVYVYRLEAGTRTAARKMVVTK
jgi:hypothetical protein